MVFQFQIGFHGVFYGNLWFQVGLSWFQVGFIVFQGSRLVFLLVQVGFYGFQGSRFVFHDSKCFFLVF